MEESLGIDDLLRQALDSLACARDRARRADDEAHRCKEALRCLRSAGSVRVAARVRPRLVGEDGECSLRVCGPAQLEVLDDVLSPRGRQWQPNASNRRRSTGGIFLDRCGADESLARSPGAPASAANSAGSGAEPSSSTATGGKLRMESRALVFDRVFDAQASDEEVYGFLREDLQAAAEGEALCVLLHGPSTAGKSHCCAALAVRAAEDLFALVRGVGDAGCSGGEATISMQVIIVRGEELFDALADAPRPLCGGDASDSLPACRERGPLHPGATLRPLLVAGEGTAAVAVIDALAAARRSASALAGAGQDLHVVLTLAISQSTSFGAAPDALGAASASSGPRKVGSFTIADLAACSSRSRCLALSNLAEVLYAREKQQRGGGCDTLVEKSALTRLLADPLDSPQLRSRVSLLVVLAPYGPATDSIQAAQFGAHLVSVRTRLSSQRMAGARRMLLMQQEHLYQRDAAGAGSSVSGGPVQARSFGIGISADLRLMAEVLRIKDDVRLQKEEIQVEVRQLKECEHLLQATQLKNAELMQVGGNLQAEKSCKRLIQGLAVFNQKLKSLEDSLARPEDAALAALRQEMEAHVAQVSRGRGQGARADVRSRAPSTPTSTSSSSSVGVVSREPVQRLLSGGTRGRRFGDDDGGGKTRDARAVQASSSPGTPGVRRQASVSVDSLCSRGTRGRRCVASPLPRSNAWRVRPQPPPLAQQVPSQSAVVASSNSKAAVASTGALAAEDVAGPAASGLGARTLKARSPNASPAPVSLPTRAARRTAPAQGSAGVAAGANRFASPHGGASQPRRRWGAATRGGDAIQATTTKSSADVQCASFSSKVSSLSSFSAESLRRVGRQASPLRFAKEAITAAATKTDARCVDISRLPTPNRARQGTSRWTPVAAASPTVPVEPVPPVAISATSPCGVTSQPTPLDAQRLETPRGGGAEEMVAQLTPRATVSGMNVSVVPSLNLQMGHPVVGNGRVAQFGTMPVVPVAVPEVMLSSGSTDSSTSTDSSSSSSLPSSPIVPSSPTVPLQHQGLKLDLSNIFHEAAGGCSADRSNRASTNGSRQRASSPPPLSTTRGGRFSFSNHLGGAGTSCGTDGTVLFAPRGKTPSLGNRSSEEFPSTPRWGRDSLGSQTGGARPVISRADSGSDTDDDSSYSLNEVQAAPTPQLEPRDVLPPNSELQEEPRSVDPSRRFDYGSVKAITPEAASTLLTTPRAPPTPRGCVAASRPLQAPPSPRGCAGASTRDFNVSTKVDVIWSPDSPPLLLCGEDDDFSPGDVQSREDADLGLDVSVSSGEHDIIARLQKSLVLQKAPQQEARCDSLVSFSGEPSPVEVAKQKITESPIAMARTASPQGTPEPEDEPPVAPSVGSSLSLISPDASSGIAVSGGKVVTKVHVPVAQIFLQQHQLHQKGQHPQQQQAAQQQKQQQMLQQQQQRLHPMQPRPQPLWASPNAWKHLPPPHLGTNALYAGLHPPASKQAMPSIAPTMAGGALRAANSGQHMAVMAATSAAAAALNMRVYR